MADYPLDVLGGKTPLEAARTPNMDWLAQHGVYGIAHVIPEGFPPGSDVGNMSIMGYDPAVYHTGRSPLEAASMGVALGAERYRVSLQSCDARRRAALKLSWRISPPAISRPKKPRRLSATSDANSAATASNFFPA